MDKRAVKADQIKAGVQAECSPYDVSVKAKGRHAVVLGGSLAGLLSARVLAGHFDRVTVVERDSFPATAEPRRGVPQANHVHALMRRGRLILEQLFPGLESEMVAAGAVPVDMANDVAWLTPRGWGVRFQSELEVLSFTRPLLDFHVRRRLALLRNVRIIENTEIVRLLGDDSGTSVVGVLVQSGRNDSDKVVGRQLQADLIVDATGRGSQAPRWLAELGCPAPEETIVDAHLGYASRLYNIPQGFNGDWTCVYIQSAPPERKRGGILFTVEGNRWLVTLIGGGRDYPPTDEAAFLGFARSLPSQVIYDAIRVAEPISAIKRHRGTENRLRHFDRLTRMPENFIALGDSVCAFNPVYGQGMTVAALGAMVLEKCLREQQYGSLARVGGFATKFQKELTKVTAGPWMMATSEDYRYRETEGGSPNLMTRFMHGYMNQVMALTTFNSSVREVLLQAFSMIVKPTALFQPKVLIRVLLYMLGILQKRERPVPKTEAQSARSKLIYNVVGRQSQG